jgi:hypothetical protein
MTPTAAQICEAQRIVYQVGVPTDKVVADVAQLIADLDDWHRKLHATQPKYQPDENQSAGQPDEARVEQRHRYMSEDIYDVLSGNEEPLILRGQVAQFLANSEAAAVASAVEKCQTPSADIIEAAVSLATAELRAQLEEAKLECKSRKEEAESWKAAWVAKDERYASVLVQLAKAEAALGVARAGQLYEH